MEELKDDYHCGYWFSNFSAEYFYIDDYVYVKYVRLQLWNFLFGKIPIDRRQDFLCYDHQ